MKTDDRQKFVPYLLSFLLFVFVSVLTLSVLCGSVFGNSRRIADAFMEPAYVDGLYQDVHLYAADLCLEYGLHDQIADSIVREDVQTVLQDYVNSKLELDKDADYTSELRHVVSALKNGAASAVPETSADALQAFSQDFESYFTSRVEFVYMDNLKTFTDVSSKIFIAGTLICALFAFAVSAVLYKNSRNKREWLLLMGDAFLASGMTTALFTAILMLIQSKKNLYFFPSYLSEAATSYIKDCLLMNLAATAVLVAIAVVCMLCAYGIGKNCKGCCTYGK